MSERVREWVDRLREATVETTDRPTVLVAFEVFEGESIPPGTFDLLSRAHVVLLGYLGLPEQTPPGQARMQFEERGERLLEDLADRFEAAGAAVDTLLSFTNEPDATVDRIASEYACDARLVLNQFADIDEVLIAVTPGFESELVLSFVAAVLLHHEPSVHLVGAGEGVGAVEIDEVRRTLVSVGFDGDRIEVADPDPGRPVARIVEAASIADLVVIAEPQGGIESFFLGDTAGRIAAGYVGPVLVVYDRAAKPPSEAGRERA